MDLQFTHLDFGYYGEVSHGTYDNIQGHCKYVDHVILVVTLTFHLTAMALISVDRLVAWTYVL